jgi:hypothetical protein
MIPFATLFVNLFKNSEAFSFFPVPVFIPHTMGHNMGHTMGHGYVAEEKGHRYFRVDPQKWKKSRVEGETRRGIKWGGVSNIGDLKRLIPRKKTKICLTICL